MFDARRKVLEDWFEYECKTNKRTMHTIKGKGFSMHAIVLDCNSCAYTTDGVWLVGSIDDIEAVWKSFK